MHLNLQYRRRQHVISLVHYLPYTPTSRHITLTKLFLPFFILMWDNPIQFILFPCQGKGKYIFRGGFRGSLLISQFS